MLSYPQVPSLPTSFGLDDADGAYRDMPTMPARFPLAVVCSCNMSVSYHIMIASVVFLQTDYITTDVKTIDPSFKALLSYPYFPSLPTSFRVELLPIHVSFGCDTI